MELYFTLETNESKLMLALYREPDHSGYLYYTPRPGDPRPHYYIQAFRDHTMREALTDRLESRLGLMVSEAMYFGLLRSLWQHKCEVGWYQVTQLWIDIACAAGLITIEVTSPEARLTPTNVVVSDGWIDFIFT